MLLTFHIAAGGLAILLGALALLVRKGGTTHRRSGLLFVYAMVIMGLTGSMIGFLKSPSDPNVRAGFTAVYFVVTALTTVRPRSRWTRSIDLVALIVAVVLAVFGIASGVQAFNTPRGTLQGVPFAMYFFMASVLLAGAAGDLRVIRSGMARGGARLARHLWRMCYALFIAAGSFFSIRARVARVLPEPFTALPIRILLIVLPFVAMFYWLWKLRGNRTPPTLVRAEPAVRVAPAK